MAAWSKAHVCDPPGAWMSVCCECCVLSGRDLCDELITRQEESYWLWCVVELNLETSWMRSPWPTGGLLRQIKKKLERACYKMIHMYVHTHSYVRTYIHAYVYTQIHTYVRTCIHAYIHTYTRRHTYACMCIIMYAYICNLFILTDNVAAGAKFRRR
jgi:hypothetical protein